MRQTLYVPDDNLKEVIEVIKTGLLASPTSDSVSEALLQWCLDQEEYLERCKGDEND